MKLSLNGKPIDVDEPDLEHLLLRNHVSSQQTGVAVAVNGVVVPKVRWSDYKLDDGDQMEVITAMQGG
jgi:sulfur carrier protein